MNASHEPPFHDDDTHPTMTVRAVDASPWKRWLGLVSLLASLAFMIGTIYLVLNPEEVTPPEIPVTHATEPAGETPESAGEATQEAQTQDNGTPVVDTTAPIDGGGLPVLDPAALVASLTSDLMPMNGETVLTSYSQPDPFTIIPDRPRDEMEQYTVVQGDTIEAIATRFGLEPESIVWSNPRRLIQVLRPGDVMNIPPQDGVFTYAQGVANTLTDYAERYEVNVEAVLAHPANRGLAGLDPNAVPPAGTPMFFPGGQAEVIIWRAEIEVTGGSSGGPSSGGGAAPTVRFQPGQPGDCGPQAIVGGTVWTNPLPSGYTITTGYSSYHPGIDLANNPGTPVVAANGGRVIFSGWNGFGYGNLIVLIHGPTMTVYGHLQDIYVGCGQDVAAGQQIGTVGSTGNSSGPHLHFEIRGAPSYLPYNPTATMGF